MSQATESSPLLPQRGNASAGTHPELHVNTDPTAIADDCLCYFTRPAPQSPQTRFAARWATASTGVSSDQTVTAQSIPPEVEPLKPWAFRESWQTLLRQDTAFIFEHLRSLFKTAWLSISTKPRHGTELYSPSKLGSFGGHVMLVISGVLTIPIAASLIVAIPSYLLLRLFTHVSEACQGKDTRLSQPPDAEFVAGYERESWLFVNGIATQPSGAQGTANYLQHLVKRPVTAILNRTMGAWFDLWECFMQRDMNLSTKDLREGYMELVKHVTDMSKDRIVLIGHSQGGIIVSAWVDQLLTDFDEDVLSRVEVYTFASAATHFSRGGKYFVEDGKVKLMPDPRWDLSNSSGSANGNGNGSNRSSAPGNGPFRFVEHFANTGDFVAQLGVLSHKPIRMPGMEETYGVFAGQIFERTQDGHGILDYYLGLGEGQSSILDVPSVASRSRLASYIVTATNTGNPLPFVPPE